MALGGRMPVPSSAMEVRPPPPGMVGHPTMGPVQQRFPPGHPGSAVTVPNASRFPGGAPGVHGSPMRPGTAALNPQMQPCPPTSRSWIPSVSAAQGQPTYSAVSPVTFGGPQQLGPGPGTPNLMSNAPDAMANGAESLYGSHSGPPPSSSHLGSSGPAAPYDPGRPGNCFGGDMGALLNGGTGGSPAAGAGLTVHNGMPGQCAAPPSDLVGPSPGSRPNDYGAPPNLASYTDNPGLTPAAPLPLGMATHPL